jgi:DnaJ-class molecular chaperone
MSASEPVSAARRCPRCDGSGRIWTTYDDYGMADPKEISCPTCNGTGKVRPA